MQDSTYRAYITLFDANLNSLETVAPWDTPNLSSRYGYVPAKMQVGTDENKIYSYIDAVSIINNQMQVYYMGFMTDGTI